MRTQDWLSSGVSSVATPPAKRLPGWIRPGLNGSTLSIPELAIHALAQLPAVVRLELGPTAFQSVLGLIVRAYRLDDRVTFDEKLSASSARFITPDGLIDPSTMLPATLGELVERIGNGSPNLIGDSLDTVLAGHRVVILTNLPTHYRLPLFKQMSTRLLKVGGHLHVIFLAAHAKSRPWLAGSQFEFSHETVHSVGLPMVDRGSLVPARLEERLRRQSASIVLAAGFSPFVAARAARVSRQAGASFGVWSGETAVMHTAQSALRHRVRLRLAERLDFAIAYGARSAEYLRGLAPTVPLVVSRNTAPVLKTVARRLSPPSGRPFRLLLIGDLASPRKGADVALQAMRYLPDGEVRLHIVGGGRLQPALQTSVAQDSRVRLLGPLRPADVGRELADADALIFPTRADIFGLALVEGMGAGLASIVSRAAGAVDDLAVDGYNAILVDGHEPSTWAKAIGQVAADPATAGKMGARARRTIEARWTIGHAVEGMMAGLRLGAIIRAERPAK